MRMSLMPPPMSARSARRCAVVQLVAAAELDEAEAAARELLVRFPDVHDCWDRLGMVHEARGDSRQAADCYRKVIDFIRRHPDNYDAGIIEQFAKLVESSIRPSRPERPAIDRDQRRSRPIPPSATVIRVPRPRLQIP